MQLKWHDYATEKPTDETCYYLLEFDPLFGWQYGLATWQNETEERIKGFVDPHGDMVSHSGLLRWAELP